MSNTFDWIPVDKTLSPMESGRRMKPEVQYWTTLECLCWFINKFLIATVRAITFWILDDVNDAFHFEETDLLLLIFEPQRFWSRTQLHSVKPSEIKGKQ